MPLCVMEKCPHLTPHEAGRVVDFYFGQVINKSAIWDSPVHRVTNNLNGGKIVNCHAASLSSAHAANPAA